jgi:hypothetical protein
MLLPDGVSLRHFVFGGVLRHAAAERQVYAYHSVPEDLLSLYQHASDGTVWVPLPDSRDTAATFVLRNALHHAHRTWAATYAGRYETHRGAGSRRREGVMRAARLIGRASASPAGIRRLRRWHELAAARSPAVSWFSDRLRALQPSVLFCAKQSSLSAIAPVLAARALNIPTATFIFSWDNITTKGHISAPFDHYLVWSDHMRRELLHYYPDIQPASVHVVGSPQFDSYAHRELLLPRDEFLRRLGADPGRPVICYSGGDRKTCPEDPAHLRILLNLIRNGVIAGGPQVVLRPMPVDDARRYDEVRQAYPELIFAAPRWVRGRNGDWTGVLPLPDDTQLLVNLVHHAGVNVNVASTMTLDFAINDRPVVNVAFDVASPPPHGRPLWHHYYQYDHYRPVVELGAARFARSPADLAAHVNAYLADPSLDRKGRQQLVALQLRGPCGQSAQRIAAVLQAIGR